MGDALVMQTLPLGRFVLLLLLQDLVLRLRALHGGLGHLPGMGQIGPHPVHLRADLVDVLQLLGREQAVRDHGPIDEMGRACPVRAGSGRGGRTRPPSAAPRPRPRQP